MRADRLVPGDRHDAARIGFFQIGGGIAGDFPICVVPMLHQDLRRTTSALGLLLPDLRGRRRATARTAAPPPNEKITWGKLDVDTPRFMIESDATIVFPLIAAYLLDM